jgi:hypothetical protein
MSYGWLHQKLDTSLYRPQGLKVAPCCISTDQLIEVQTGDPHSALSSWEVALSMFVDASAGARWLPVLARCA